MKGGTSVATGTGASATAAVGGMAAAKKMSWKLIGGISGGVVIVAIILVVVFVGRSRFFKGNIFNSATTTAKTFNELCEENYGVVEQNGNCNFDNAQNPKFDNNLGGPRIVPKNDSKSLYFTINDFLNSECTKKIINDKLITDLQQAVDPTATFGTCHFNAEPFDNLKGLDERHTAVQKFRYECNGSATTPIGKWTPGIIATAKNVCHYNGDDFDSVEEFKKAQDIVEPFKKLCIDSFGVLDNKIPLGDPTSCVFVGTPYTTKSATPSLAEAVKTAIDAITKECRSPFAVANGASWTKEIDGFYCAFIAWGDTGAAGKFNIADTAALTKQLDTTAEKLRKACGEDPAKASGGVWVQEERSCIINQGKENELKYYTSADLQLGLPCTSNFAKGNGAVFSPGDPQTKNAAKCTADGKDYTAIVDLTAELKTLAEALDTTCNKDLINGGLVAKSLQAKWDAADTSCTLKDSKSEEHVYYSATVLKAAAFETVCSSEFAKANGAEFQKAAEKGTPAKKCVFTSPDVQLDKMPDLLKKLDTLATAVQTTCSANKNLAQAMEWVDTGLTCAVMPMFPDKGEAVKNYYTLENLNQAINLIKFKQACLKENGTVENDQCILTDKDSGQKIGVFSDIKQLTDAAAQYKECVQYPMGEWDSNILQCVAKQVNELKQLEDKCTEVKGTYTFTSEDKTKAKCDVTDIGSFDSLDALNKGLKDAKDCVDVQHKEWDAKEQICGKEGSPTIAPPAPTPAPAPAPPPPPPPPAAANNDLQKQLDDLKQQLANSKSDNSNSAQISNLTQQIANLTQQLKDNQKAQQVVTVVPPAAPPPAAPQPVAPSPPASKTIVAKTESASEQATSRETSEKQTTKTESAASAPAANKVDQEAAQAWAYAKAQASAEAQDMASAEKAAKNAESRIAQANALIAKAEADTLTAEQKTAALRAQAEAEAAAAAAAQAQAKAAQKALAAAQAAKLHGAYIQGKTGPEILLYPLLMLAANGMYYYMRKRKRKKA